MFFKFQTLSIAIVALAATHSIVNAQRWTGVGGDNNWSTVGNWNGPPAVPGSGNTAVFNGDGNGVNSISLGGGAQLIGSIDFNDDDSVVPYTLGVTAGDQFVVDGGGAITLTSGAPAQTVNAKVNGLGALSLTNNGSGGLSFGNTVTSNGALSISSTSTGPVTISGNVTPTASTVSLSTSLAGSAVTVGGSISNTTGLTIAATNGNVNLNGSAAVDGVIAVSGAGTVAFNAPITNGTSSSAGIADTMTTGTLVLNSANSYSAGTSILLSGSSALHAIRIGNDAAFGTGPITTAGTVPALYYPIGADRTIANDIGTSGLPASQGMFYETASAVVDPTGPHSLTLTGNIFLSGARTFTNNLVGGTLTLGSVGSLNTITRNNNLTFQSQAQVQPTGGVMVLNEAIAASTGSGVVTFQNGLKVTINNTIGGNGTLTVQSTAAPNTVAHFNMTGMYTGTGNVNILNNNATATTGTTVYFDQPNVFGATLSAFPATSIVNPTGLGTTVYVNSPLITNHRWDIEGDAVVYFNAPTTFNGTATSAFQVQGANTRKQTAMVINSTLTKGPNAGSGVRVATGTLAGNGGTILSGVSILTSTNGPSYLAPGLPAVPGGTNVTPSYQNGPGLLTIGASGNPFSLDFSGTTNCNNAQGGCTFYAEIGGATPGTQYDQVVVNGTATIGSTANKKAHLAVALINGYTRPAADTVFELIKATTLSPGSGAGLGFIDTALPDANWSVQYGTTIANSLTVSVLGTGDFNGDHFVDSADYVVWRKTDGTAGGYAAFLRNFGNPAGGGSGLNGGTVPEPGTIALLGTALIALAYPRRRCYSSARFLD